MRLTQLSPVCKLKRFESERTLPHRDLQEYGQYLTLRNTQANAIQNTRAAPLYAHLVHFNEHGIGVPLFS